MATRSLHKSSTRDASAMQLCSNKSSKSIARLGVSVSVTTTSKVHKAEKQQFQFSQKKQIQYIRLYIINLSPKPTAPVIAFILPHAGWAVVGVPAMRHHRTRELYLVSYLYVPGTIYLVQVEATRYKYVPGTRNGLRIFR